MVTTWPSCVRGTSGSPTPFLTTEIASHGAGVTSLLTSILIVFFANPSSSMIIMKGLKVVGISIHSPPIVAIPAIPLSKYFALSMPAWTVYSLQLLISILRYFGSPSGGRVMLLLPNMSCPHSTRLFISHSFSLCPPISVSFLQATTENTVAKRASNKKT